MLASAHPALLVLVGSVTFRDTNTLRVAVHLTQKPLGYCETHNFDPNHRLLARSKWTGLCLSAVHLNH
jgi:hypothetical protein